MTIAGLAFSSGSHPGANRRFLLAVLVIITGHADQ